MVSAGSVICRRDPIFTRGMGSLFPVVVRSSFIIPTGSVAE
jgi:hypothetical protein